MKKNKVILSAQLETTLEKYSDQDVLGYFMVYGQAMMLWGRFENTLAQTLLAISQLPFIHHEPPGHVPNSFAQKTKLWRTWFDRTVELSPLRNFALDFIKDALEASRDRNVLAHAHFDRFVREEPLTARFVSHRHRTTKLDIERHDISLEHLNAVVAKIDNLQGRLISVTWRICQSNPIRVSDRQPPTEP